MQPDDLTEPSTAAAEAPFDQLCSDLVVHAARLLRAVQRSNDRSAGVRVLSILDEHGPLGVTALAEADQCSQPTMSGAVNRLRDLGWVSTAPNPSDARGSLVALTQEGREELSRVRAVNARIVTERLEAHPRLTADDLATAVAVLRDLTARTERPGS